MSNLINVSSNFANQTMTTMSSREIAELTGKDHKNILADIRKMLTDLGLTSAEFSVDLPDSYGRMQTAFKLPKRECLILVSGYSVAMRAKIIDRWQELESVVMKQQVLPSSPLRDELEAVDVLARILSVSTSSKLGLVKASLNHHGASHLLPSLPVYAIDAPPSVMNNGSESSWQTLSATELIKRTSANVTVREFNKLAIEHGLIEERTRPSKSGVKFFKAFTNNGLEYGKNVTSPHDQRETQPLWYENRFHDVLDLLDIDYCR